MTVSFQKMNWTGEYDWAAIDRFVANEAKKIQKAAKRFGNDCTEAEAIESAKQLAEIYKHNFRVLTAN